MARFRCFFSGVAGADGFYRVPDVDADGRDEEFARSDMLYNVKSYGVAHEWLRVCTWA